MLKFIKDLFTAPGITGININNLNNREYKPIYKEPKWKWTCLFEAEIALAEATNDTETLEYYKRLYANKEFYLKRFP